MNRGFIAWEDDMRSDREKRRDAVRDQRKQARMKILKRRRRLLIAAIVAVIAIIVLLVLYFMGTFYKKAKSTTLTLESNGTVTFEEVTDLSEDYYDAKEMKTFVKDTIKSYNSENGKNAVSLEYYAVDGDTVYCRTTYKSVDVYEDFTGYYAYAGTVAEAKSDEGLDFNDSFVTVEDGAKGDTATVDTVTETDDNEVLVIEENCTVEVPGDIVYVTDSGTEVTGTDTVTISASDSDADALEKAYIVYK